MRTGEIKGIFTKYRKGGKRQSADPKEGTATHQTCVTPKKEGNLREKLRSIERKKKIHVPAFLRELEDRPESRCVTGTMGGKKKARFWKGGKSKVSCNSRMGKPQGLG